MVMGQSGSISRAAVSGFQPVIEGRVYVAAAQPDGRVVIGGSFGRVSGVARRNLARLLPDGRIDPTLSLAADGAVLAACACSDGTTLVGGLFTKLNGGEHPGLARLLPDGSADPNFLVAAAGVRAIAVDDLDRVWITGDFKTVNGLSRPGMARLLPTGALDPSFHPQSTPWYHCLLPRPDGSCLTGRSRVSLVSADGTRVDDWPMPEGVFGTVFQLLPHPDGGVIADGSFTRFDPETNKRVARPGLIKYDASGVPDADFPKASLDPEVLATAAAPDGRLYVVLGSYRGIGPQARELVRLTPDGSLDSDWRVKIAGQPFSMVFQSPDSLLLVGNGLSAPIDGLAPTEMGPSGGTARIRASDGRFDFSDYTAWRIQRFFGAAAWDSSISDPLEIPIPGRLPNFLNYALFRNASPDAGISLVDSLTPGGRPGVQFSYSPQAYDAVVTLQCRDELPSGAWRDVARASRGGPLVPLEAGAAVEQSEIKPGDYFPTTAVYSPPSTAPRIAHAWYRLSVTPYVEP